MESREHCVKSGRYVVLPNKKKDKYESPNPNQHDHLNLNLNLNEGSRTLLFFVGHFTQSPRFSGYPLLDGKEEDWRQ
jgi:hypothetical protein